MYIVSIQDSIAECNRTNKTMLVDHDATCSRLAEKKGPFRCLSGCSRSGEEQHHWRVKILSGNVVSMRSHHLWRSYTRDPPIHLSRHEAHMTLLYGIRFFGAKQIPNTETHWYVPVITADLFNSSSTNEALGTIPFRKFRSPSHRLLGLVVVVQEERLVSFQFGD